MFAGRLRKLAFSSVAALARGARSRTAEGSLQCNVFSHELDILKPAGLASQSRSYFNGPRYFDLAAFHLLWGSSQFAPFLKIFTA